MLLLFSCQSLLLLSSLFPFFVEPCDDNLLTPTPVDKNLKAKNYFQIMNNKCNVTFKILLKYLTFAVKCHYKGVELDQCRQISHEDRGQKNCKSIIWKSNNLVITNEKMWKFWSKLTIYNTNYPCYIAYITEFECTPNRNMRAGFLNS